MKRDPNRLYTKGNICPACLRLDGIETPITNRARMCKRHQNMFRQWKKKWLNSPELKIQYLIDSEW